MGSTNVGNSVHIFSYKQELTSRGFNKLRYKVTPPGIYDAVEVEKINDSSVYVKPGTFVINDDTNEVTVKIKTSTDITLSVSNIDYMLIFRMGWLDAESNYVSCLSVEPSEVLESDVVVGKLVYSGATLNSIDYSYRSYGNQTTERTLISTADEVLWVDPGTNFWFIDGWDISYIQEKVKANYVVMSVSGSYYLVYNGTTYTTEADTTVMSYDYEKKGYYDSNGYRVLAHLNYDTGSNEIGIIEIYEGVLPVLDNFKKYLDSAKKQLMAYSSGLLDSITYYNHPTTEDLTTTMAVEGFTYTSGVLSESTLAIYYPAGTLWKTYTYTYTYSSGLLESITYTIS